METSNAGVNILKWCTLQTPFLTLFLSACIVLCRNPCIRTKMPPHFQNYACNLSAANKISYQKKIQLCACLDPYEIDRDTCETSTNYFPSIEHGDIVNYLVFSTCSVTLQEMKAYKSLESHNYFTSGWVKPTIYIKELERNKIILLGEVNHSQSLRLKPLKVWVLTKKSGEIMTANCTCVAGLGGTCSHVGALLFYVENLTRQVENNCTSFSNTWLPPYSKNATVAKIKDLNFASSKKRKTQIDDNSAPVVLQRKVFKEPTEDVFKDFLMKVSEVESNAAILKIVPPFCDNFVNKMPLSLKQRFYDEKNCELSWYEICSVAKDIMNNKISLSQEEIEIIEVNTRGQRNNKEWFCQREGRITASVMRKVFCTNLEQPSYSLLKQICHPELSKFTKTKATNWGLKNETSALQAYFTKQKILHQNLKMKKNGLLVHVDFPFLGASPDAQISCDCCGVGVCEIKCPYTLKDSTLEELPSNPYVEYDEIGNLSLKKDSDCFYQLQTQMFVCNADYADFVLWTKKSLYIERIFPDTLFWEGVLEKATVYFLKCILPEIIAKWFTRNSV